MNLIEQANVGDPKALAEIQTRFDHDPDLLAYVGDLAGLAEAMIARLAVGENSPAVVDGILAQHAAMCRELEAECQSELERVLARRVAVGSLWAGVADIQLVQSQQSDPVGTGPAVRDAVERADKAQRRVERAARCLGLLRKLTRPARSPVIVFNAGNAPPGEPAIRSGGEQTPARRPPQLGDRRLAGSDA
jgi:hypothetical protein